MDAVTLAEAFRCPRDRADRYVAAMNEAMLRAECTTVRRAAAWCAQVGHETLGLRYQEEIADGSAYEGRQSLGNAQPGDGRRFKGRGWIQLTGRANYGAFSAWCAGRGLADAGTFVHAPQLVAQPPWSGLAAAWYWTVARKTINARADAGDVLAVTKLINGGTNGLADRQDRYDVAIKLGERLLPTGGTPATTPGGDWFDMASMDDLRRVIREETGPTVWNYPVFDLFTADGRDTMPAHAAVGWGAAHGAHTRQDVGALRVELAALRAALAGVTAGAGTPMTPDQIRALFVEALQSLDVPLHLTGRSAA